LFAGFFSFVSLDALSLVLDSFADESFLSDFSDDAESDDTLSFALDFPA
jgi:hypothetical protein